MIAVKNRRKLLGVQAVISVAMIAALVVVAKPNDLVAALQALSLGSVLLCCFVLVAFHVLSATRLWWILLIFKVDVSLPVIARLHWLGLFASNFLPSTIGGDAVIAAVLHREQNALVPILSGLAANRIVSIVALGSLLPFVLLIRELRPLHEMALQSLGGLSIILIGLAAIALGAWGLSQYSRGRASNWTFWLVRLRPFFLLVFAKPKLFALAWVLSLIMMAVAALGVAVLNWSIRPDTAYFTVLGVMLIYSAVQLIPIAFNGIGLQEATITVCFTQIGWPLDTAIAFSLGVRLVGVIISLPGLPILLSTWPKVAKKHCN